MAFEAVVFSEDSLRSYNNYCSKEYNLYTNCDTIDFGMNYDFVNYSSLLLLEDNEKDFLNNNDGIFDVINNSNDNDNNVNNNQCDYHSQQRYKNNGLYDYSSPERCLSGEAPQVPVLTTVSTGNGNGGVQRKRRRRSRKNKEEVEQQRMTHIAVERNRRKQMNEYLATIRSLMPPTYIQRGDQASIVGGAINYVKELEQLLQSMEAQKRNNDVHQVSHPQQNQQEDNQKPSSQSPIGVSDVDTQPPPPIFGEFFSFPQYSITRSDTVSTRNEATGEIEVTMVESHANVKILAKKQPKQLVKLIAAFQGLRLNVLHLNVTTLDSFVLYSLSLKVEDGCQLNSVDDIAAASNHILAQIQEEAKLLVVQ